MITKKSYKYRLTLTKEQESSLQHVLDVCRGLYNLCLEHKKLAYEELDISLSKNDQLMLLPLLKKEQSILKEVHSQVLQDVVIRLHKAFDGFFRRVAAGEKPGFPRFRGCNRYNSFTYPQSGFSITSDIVELSKIGKIRMRCHRPIRGTIKTCTITKSASGKWFACFSCEVESFPLPKTEKAVGIDVGVENFAYFSDGQVIKNPRFFKQEEKALAKAQRKLEKLEKGSIERNKQRKVVAKVHERICNKRSDFCHQTSRAIINTYQYICVEDLDIQEMVLGSRLGHKMSLSIADASWARFRECLSYKAEEAGRMMYLVDPAYTSQDCSKCGHREKKKLSERRHCCSNCGYTTHRDHNASENILALGLDGLGESPRSSRIYARE